MKSASNYLEHLLDPPFPKLFHFQGNYLWKPPSGENSDFNTFGFIRNLLFTSTSASSYNVSSFYNIYQLDFSCLRIASTIHNSFQPFTIACNHTFSYPFPIKPIQESRWDQALTYAAFCSILATCYISSANLFRIHFWPIPLTEVTSTVTNVQPEVINLGIPYVPSSLLMTTENVSH